MKQELSNHIKENQQIVVCGLEGSGKSRDVLDIVLNSGIFDFKNEYIIYTMSSYEMLHERQRELMKHYKLTEKEVPVVALNDVEDDNKKYIDSNGYYDETKIVLMPIQVVKKIKHLTLTPLDFEENFSQKHKIMKCMIIDEFDFMSTIIPSLDHIQNANALSKSKKSVLEFVRDNYSQMDVMRYKSAIKNGKADSFMKAYYLTHNDMNRAKTIFITSEKIPEILLGEIGYNAFNNEQKEFKNHKIHIKSDLVNSYTYNRINNNFKWGMFGFKHIITDKYNPNMELQHDTECISVRSHIGAKGSNAYEGEVKELLSIVSHVPNAVVRSITDAINFYCSSELFGEEGYYKFDYVKALYYRDRLFQAVGRVIGFRGEKNGVEDAWVLISDTIYKGIVMARRKCKLAKRKDYLGMPYKIVKWDFDVPEWNEVVEAVRNDSRIQKESKKTKRIQLKEIDEVLIDEFIENNIEATNEDGDLVKFSDVKNRLKESGIKTTVTRIANKLGLQYKLKKVKGNVGNYIIGAKLK